jgi:hypothetical protein
MMKQINETYLLKLLESSEIFSEEQKFAIKNSLIRIPASKLNDLLVLLKKEQVEMTEFYKQAVFLNKEFTEAKIKVIYKQAEEKVKEEESDILASLDEELALITD